MHSLYSCVLSSPLSPRFAPRFLLLYFFSSDAPVPCLAPVGPAQEQAVGVQPGKILLNSDTSAANVAQQGCVPLRGC